GVGGVLGACGGRTGGVDTGGVDAVGDEGEQRLPRLDRPQVDAGQLQRNGLRPRSRHGSRGGGHETERPVAAEGGGGGIQERVDAETAQDLHRVLVGAEQVTGFDRATQQRVVRDGGGRLRMRGFGGGGRAAEQGGRADGQCAEQRETGRGRAGTERATRRFHR